MRWLAVLPLLAFAACSGGSDSPAPAAPLAVTATASTPGTVEPDRAELSLNEWAVFYCGALDRLAERPFTPAALQEVIRDNDTARFGSQLLVFADTALDLAELFDETAPPAEADSYHRFMTEFFWSTGLIWKAAARDLDASDPPAFMRVMEDAGFELQEATVRIAGRVGIQDNESVNAAVESACPSRFALESEVLDQWAITFCEPINDIVQLALVLDSEDTPLAAMPGLIEELERRSQELAELAAVDEETKFVTGEYAGVYGGLAAAYRSVLDAIEQAEGSPASERVAILTDANAEFVAALEALEARRVQAATDASSAFLASVVRAGCFQ